MFENKAPVKYYFKRTKSIQVFNKFLLKDATDRSKISSDQTRLFFAQSLDPLSFFANITFKGTF